MKSRLLVSIAFVLLVAMSVTGCSRGRALSDEEKINRVLNELANGYKNKDAERIANLFSYPANIEGRYVETREQFVQSLQNVFKDIIVINDFLYTEKTITITNMDALAEVKIRSIYIITGGLKLDIQGSAAIYLYQTQGEWKITNFVNLEAEP